MINLRRYTLLHLLPALLLLMVLQMVLGYWLMVRPLLLPRIDAVVVELRQGLPSSSWLLPYQEPPAASTASVLPFNLLLSERLRSEGLSKGPVYVAEKSGHYWFRVDGAFPRTVQFDYTRLVGAAPAMTFWLLLCSALLTAALTAGLLAWSLVRPLLRLQRELARLPGTPDAEFDISTLKPNPINELAVLQTQFIKLWQQLVELVAQRTTLLFGLSHDMRAPLTRLYLQVGLMKNREPERALALERDVQQLRVIVDAFCDAGNRLSSTVTAVSADQLRDLLQQQYGKQAGIEWYWRGDLQRSLTLNLNALQRVLSNLISNALNYGAPPVEIHLYSAADWQIEVIDHGLGIARDQRPYIWLPFRRGVAGNSGLGLAIVKLLCQQNGWSIRLQDSEHVGAHFVLVIPGTRS
jgi:two-component system osmolarity sensor histidine kinase EnvZ